MASKMTEALVIADRSFQSRLFLGTGKYASGMVMAESLEASGTEMVTMAMRRVQIGVDEDAIMDFLDRDRYQILPNTSGVRDAKEAIFAAELAREALETNWLKLEIHPGPEISDAGSVGNAPCDAGTGETGLYRFAVCACRSCVV